MAYIIQFINQVMTGVDETSRISAGDFLFFFIGGGLMATGDLNALGGIGMRRAGEIVLLVVAYDSLCFGAYKRGTVSGWRLVCHLLMRK